MLGRIITYEAHGITYEADPGHMEGGIHQLGLADAKSVPTPGIKDDSELSAAEILERRKGYLPPSLKVGPHAAITADTWDSDPGALQATTAADSPPLTGELLQLY